MKSLLRGEVLNRIPFRNKKSFMFQIFRNSHNQRELLLKESLRILKEEIFFFRSLIVCAGLFALGNTKLVFVNINAETYRSYFGICLIPSWSRRKRKTSTGRFNGNLRLSTEHRRRWGGARPRDCGRMRFGPQSPMALTLWTLLLGNSWSKNSEQSTTRQWNPWNALWRMLVQTPHRK